MKSLITTLIFAFSLCAIHLHAQSWQALGNDDLYLLNDYHPSLNKVQVLYSDSGNVYINSRKWNGTKWVDLNSAGLPFHSGSGTYSVYALNKATGAYYYACRDFYHNNKVSVFKYNGSDWAYVGLPGFSAGTFTALDLKLDKYGFPWVAFSDAANNNRLTVMKYNGTSWSIVGTPGVGLDAINQMSIAFNSFNTPFVACHKSVFPNLLALFVTTFNGSSWTTLLDGADRASSVDIDINSADEVFVSYEGFGNNVLKYNGAGWNNLNLPVYPLTIGPNDSLYRPGPQKFNGSSWVNVASTPPPTPGSGYPYVNKAFDFGPNGKIAALFGNSAGSYYSYVLDSNTWHEMKGRGIGGQVTQLSTVIGNNDTVFAIFRDDSLGRKASCYKFNGATWTPVGPQGLSAGAVNYCVSAIDKNNRIYVAYCDSTAGSKARVMRFNGSGWESIDSVGLGLNPIYSLEIVMDTANVPYLLIGEGGSGLKIKKLGGSSWSTVGQSLPPGKGHLAIDKTNTPEVCWWGYPNPPFVYKYNSSANSWDTISGPLPMYMYSAYPSDIKFALDSADAAYVIRTVDTVNSSYLNYYKGQLLKSWPLYNTWINCGNPFTYGYESSPYVAVDFEFDNNTPYSITAVTDSSIAVNGVYVRKLTGSAWARVGPGRLSGASSFYVDIGIKNHNVIASYISAGSAIIKRYSLVPVTGITVQPVSQYVCLGTNVVFSVSAVNANSYQWQVDAGAGWVNVVNGSHYSGATTTSLTVLNVPPSSDGYHYRCLAIGNYHTEGSTAALLSVILSGQITAKINVNSRSICSGAPVIFSGSVTGAYGNMSYLWKVNGNNVSTYSTTSMVAGNDFANGDAVRFIASSSAGCVTPDTAVYYPTVYPKPVPTLTGTPCSGMPLTVQSPLNLSQLEWKYGTVVSPTSIGPYDWGTISAAQATWSDTAVTRAGTSLAGSSLNELNTPQSVFLADNGDLYVADKLNHRILKFPAGSSTGVVVAGGNGLGATASKLRNPTGVFVDDMGNVYIADALNNRVQKWAPGASSGTTVAGGNGAGAAANQLHTPVAVYVNKYGTVYVSDQDNNRIQRWAKGAASGVTVAGAASGVAGGALNRLNKPEGFYVDSLNGLYIADRLNHRILKWPAGANTGTKVAGGSSAGSIAAKLNNPTAVFKIEDGTNYLLIVDQLNHRIQKWKEGATSGVTVAGGNGSGNGNDQMSKPVGITLDNSGNIYVSDQLNHRIQKYLASYNPQLTMLGAAGNYKAILTSFKGCKDSIISPSFVSTGIILSSDTVIFDHRDGVRIEYIAPDCHTLAILEDYPGGNVPGVTSVAVTRKNTTQLFNSKPYLRRYFSIISSSIGYGGRIFLPVHQSDFTSYNNYLTANNLPYHMLPSGANDATGISHIVITQFKGTPSSGTTGPNGCYDSSQKVVIPSSDITAYTQNGYWILYFGGYYDLSGGFFIHSDDVVFKGAEIPSSEQSESSDLITAYPNPTSGLLTIETTLGLGRVRLMDLSGKLISDQPIDGRTTMDMSGLASGLYMLRYSNNERTEMIKLIKQ